MKVFSKAAGPSVVLVSLVLIAPFSARAGRAPASRRMMRGATVCDFLAHQVWGGKA